MSLFITILAGGIGKRMESEIPKVLHKVNNESMIVRIIKESLILNPDKILIVVGKFYLDIKKEIDNYIESDKITYIIQNKPLGTGHAILCTLPYLNNENNIILNGDVPLIKAETIKEIYDYYLIKKSKLLITSINSDNPTGNGRIILENNIFKEIIEEKDCNNEEKKINLINCGIYIANSEVLIENIPKINNRNSQKEYYITDLVKIYSASNIIDLFILDKNKEKEIFNVNTKYQLSQINKNKYEIYI